MRRSRVRKWAYRTLTAVAAFSSAVSALIATCLKSDATYWDTKVPWLASTLRWSQNQAPIVVPSLIVVTFMAMTLRRGIGDPWIWDTVRGLLEQVRRYAFRDRSEGDPIHYHRVTLFRHTRFRLCMRRWPWSGWLIPVERSGHTTRKCKVAFFAPDDAKRTEGVAGRTWSENKQVEVYDLPEITADSGERNLKKYAEKGFVSLAWLRDWLSRETSVARSFHGIPIEVQGKVWGVLILDSRDPSQICKDADDFYTMISWNLGKLLEKG